MRADRMGGADGIDRLVRDVECGLSSAAQQPVSSVAGVNNAFNTDDDLGVDLPVVIVEFPRGIEDADGAAFVAVAAFVMAVVRTQRRRGGGELRDVLVQGRLVALDLDDQVDAGLLGDVKGFF
jgi:hypothetical protein